MGFFNNDFLHKRRVQWKDSIKEFQYQVENTWYNANITSSGVSGNKVLFSVVLPAVPEKSHIVTGIRLIDDAGNEAANQKINIERTTYQTLLLSFSFPIQEV